MSVQDQRKESVGLPRPRIKAHEAVGVKTRSCFTRRTCAADRSEDDASDNADLVDRTSPGVEPLASTRS